MKIKGTEILERPGEVGDEELMALVKYFTEIGTVPTGWTEYVWGLAMPMAYIDSYIQATLGSKGLTIRWDGTKKARMKPAMIVNQQGVDSFLAVLLRTADVRHMAEIDTRGEYTPLVEDKGIFLARVEVEEGGWGNSYKLEKYWYLSPDDIPEDDSLQYAELIDYVTWLKKLDIPLIKVLVRAPGGMLDWPGTGPVSVSSFYGKIRLSIVDVEEKIEEFVDREASCRENKVVLKDSSLRLPESAFDIGQLKKRVFEIFKRPELRH